MAHLTKDKSKTLARVRRLKGQIEAVERAIEAEAECAAILQLVAAVRGAAGGLTAELLEEHLEHHVAGVEDAEARKRGAEEMIAAFRTYMK
ncbi:metal-sensing transcriptional repressor [Cereibacter johrii]|uniref:metal-sensing transcriptional repressor n=1 Tax=Cereibacter johrii TaxID=445629 RepID=UPI000DCD7320|nr:metal-sensing transcriptional repressor [Cereibacter johrii]RAZ85295.1 metal/formaldehyde-sensitive transcriptional repressor [Cereibacter johrii]